MNDFKKFSLLQYSPTISTNSTAMTTEAKDKTDRRTVYAFKFCYCIYESAYATISIHWTEKGAKRAMRAHKKQELADSNYNSDKRWTVQPITIEP